MLMLMDAPGKVNLCLLVGPRRDDGYHDLFSVFAPVDLSDRLEFNLSLAPAQADGSAPADGPADGAGSAGAGAPWGAAAPAAGISLRCPGIEGEENLVMRALRAVEREVGRSITGEVRLDKRIPVAAGMGGGSSDAAAALRAAARLLHREAGLSVDAATLHRLARSLGADVPFFLRARPVIATGIGDMLEPIALPTLSLVLLLPEEPLATRAVYSAFDLLPVPGGGEGFTERCRVAEARWRGVSAAGIDEVVKALENDLEAAAQTLLPALGARKRDVLEAGALGVLMSGSGPTLFGVCRSITHAEEVARSLAERGHRARAVTTAARGV